MGGKTKVFKHSIRKACFDDLEAIHSLDQRLFPPGVRFDMNTFYFHLVDPASFIFIGDDNGSITAFVILRIETRKIGTIVTVDVEPEFQGLGIGSRLMGAVDGIASFSNLNSIVLQVSVKNRGAQKFYKKLGFSSTRLLKGYYQDGEDAWEMKRIMNGKI